MPKAFTFFTQEFLDKYKDKEVPFGPLGYITYKRTYARWIEDENRSEEWFETCARVLSGNFGIEYMHLGGVGCSHILDEAQQAYDDMFHLKWLPPGRGLWMSGTSTALENGSCLTNCYYVNVEPQNGKVSYPFTFTMDMLMLGAGVGFGVGAQYLDKIPMVLNPVELHVVCSEQHRDYQFLNANKYPVGVSYQSFRLEDNRNGWVYGLKKIIDTAFLSKRGNSKTLVLDVSDIRASGEAIKGFGGTASGPHPLIECFRSINSLLNSRVGQHISAVDATDIMTMIGRCVVSGNVRRSAMIALGDATEAFMTMKNPKEGDTEHNERIKNNRWASNNSVYITPDTDFDALAKSILVKGEPGFINVALLAQYGRLCDEPQEDKAEGTNPCVTGDTKIYTYEGVKTFEELAAKGTDVLVWCIDLETNRPKLSTMRRPHKTRENVELLEVEFDSGLKVKCTPDHNFFTLQRNKVQAKDLKPGISVSSFNVHQHKRGGLRVVRNAKATDTVKQDFLHRVVAERFGLDIEDKVVHHIDGDPTNNDVSNLEVLTPIQHNQEHYPNRVLNGFFHGKPGKNASAILNHKVVSVVKAGCGDVYNGLVEDNHNYVIVDPEPVGKAFLTGVLSANCGEISLESYEPCNLAEIFPSNCKDFEEVQRVALTAYRYAKRVTLSKYPVKESQEVVSRNRRIGVSISGITDWILQILNNEPIDTYLEEIRGDGATIIFQVSTSAVLTTKLDTLYKLIKEEDKRYSGVLQVPQSIKLTTVKPSGTISLLAGTSPGIHHPYAQYYIRRIQFQDNDPLVVYLKDCGFSVQKSASTPNAVVVCFPIKAKTADLVGFRSANDVSTREQLMLQYLLQRHWADNQVSCTISLQESDEAEFPNLLREFSQHLKSCSFLPYSPKLKEHYPDLPYEPISAEEYQEMLKQVKEWPKRLPQDAKGLEIDNEECLGGHCPVK